MEKKITQDLLVTKKKNFCELCKNYFSTKGNLKNHISTIHNNIRPFKCPYDNCDKSYSNKSRLDVHIRTHVTILYILIFIHYRQEKNLLFAKFAQKVLTKKEISKHMKVFIRCFDLLNALFVIKRIKQMDT